MTPTLLKLLADVPLFADLPPAALAEVAAATTPLDLPAGAVLCRAGEPGDRLYIVDLGELWVWAGEPGEGEPLQRLGRAECVGEMALVTGAPRSATVTAGRASTLLVVDRAAFGALTAAHPAVLEAVARLVCRRLVAQNRGERKENLRAVAVVGGRERGVVAEALARLVASFSDRPVLWVRGVAGSTDGGALVNPHVEGHLVRLEGTSGGTPRDVEQLIWAARDRFARVVVDLAPADAALAAHCHAVVRVGVEKSSNDKHLDDFNVQIVGHHAPPAHACDPYVLTADALVGSEPGHRLADDRSRSGLALRRLARKLLGRSLGLALGGGAAYGFAHAGVLQALDTHGIEVDLLTGASAGAFFALAYAAGRSGDACVRYSETVGMKTVWRGSDPTVGRSGFLIGDGLKALFNELAAPATTFADLVRPARAVATDVTTGERVDLGTGRLDDAFRASCSIPMLVEPVRLHGRLLVDGAMVDPVPADLLREMGADLVLAVNVGQRPKPGARNTLSTAWEKINRFNPLTWPGRIRSKGAPPAPSLLEVGLNAMEATQYELGRHGALSADHVLNPDLAGFIWTDFHRPREMIQRGAEAVERALPTLRTLIAPGGAP